MKNKISVQNMIVMAILGLLTIAMVYRSFYGFNFRDEAYYLAMPDRIWKGDHFIVDEWHPSQLFFILSTPLYRLYRFIVSDGQYSYLVFRWIAIFGTLLISVLLYKKIKSEASIFLALPSAIIVLLYCRGLVFGLKYYDVYVWLLIASVLAYEKANKTHNRLYYIACGMLLTATSCCMPFFGVAIVGLLIYRLVKPKEDKQVRQDLLGVLIGIVVLGLGILLYLVAGADGITRLMRNFPYLLRDEGHAGGPLIYISNALKDVIHVLSIPGVVLILIAWLMELYGKHSIQWLSVGFFVVRSLMRAKEPNQVYILFAAFMFPCIAKKLSIKRADRTQLESLGIDLYLMGLVASICFAAGSDVTSQAISTGAVLVSVGTICLFDYKNCSLYVKTMYGLPIVLFIVIAFLQRISVVTIDTPLATMVKHNVCVDNGVLKGLYISEEDYERYTDIQGLVKQIDNQNKGERVYISGWLMWAYVDSSLKCASSGVWSGPVFPTQKLDWYYKSHPEMLPSVIIVEKYDNQERGLKIEDLEPRVGPTLLDFYSENVYDIMESKYAIAYVLKNNDLF